jgi:hypothetical protein
VLLKHIGITTKEHRQYGDAAVRKEYQQVKTYYVFIQNSLVPIKKSDALIEALNDKKREIEAFISANKLKLNKEQDIKSLISYYNKL